MNYYYLISSLPEISPEMDASKLEIEELFDVIKRNLSKADSRYLRYLIYPNDINNLIAVISKNDHGWSSVEFKKPSIFDDEDIETYKKNRRNFPDFMNDFLSENEDRLANMSRREIEDALFERFYNEVFNLDNNFLTNYYQFIRELKSLIAAFNFNTYDFLSQPKIQDADRLIVQVGANKSPSASVLRDYPYLEELIKVLPEDQPEKTERFIDKIIWNFLDEMSGNQFSCEAVLAYTLKLKIVKRWLSIKSQPNDQPYEHLLDKIIPNKSSEKSPLL